MLKVLSKSDVISTGNQWFVTKPVLEFPMTIQITLLGVMTLAAVMGFLYSVRLARSERQPYPLFVFFGLGFSVVFEPLGILMLHVAYAEVGQINLLRAYGYNVGLTVLPVYFVLGGWPAVWMLQKVRRGISFTSWMTIFLIFSVIMYLFEIPGLHAANGPLWEYYGPQPLMLWGYPLPMAFANASGFLFVTSATAHLLLKNDFVSNNQWLLLPLMTIAFPCAASTAIFPWGFAINSTGDQFFVDLSGIFSIALSFFLVWFFGKLVCVAEKKTQHISEMKSAPNAV